jgi:hypothetical protein
MTIHGVDTTSSRAKGLQVSLIELPSLSPGIVITSGIKLSGDSYITGQGSPLSRVSQIVTFAFRDKYAFIPAPARQR